MSAATFDIASHHRRRTLAAEARADGFERELRKAHRLLARALRVAAGGECDPLVLLRLLERLDEIPQKRGASIDELAVLLRETAP